MGLGRDITRWGQEIEGIEDDGVKSAARTVYGGVRLALKMDWLPIKAFFAKKDDIVTGVMLLQEKHAYTVVDYLLVSPSHIIQKTRGIGSTLLRKAMEECIDNKTKGIVLYSLKTASGFYKKWGFVSITPAEGKWDYLLTAEKIARILNREEAA